MQVFVSVYVSVYKREAMFKYVLLVPQNSCAINSSRHIRTQDDDHPFFFYFLGWLVLFGEARTSSEYFPVDIT